jgi:protein phosphatase 2C family protein 2/3
MSSLLGDLAMSRAFGHFYMKTNEDLTVEEQVVTANPEITSHDISSEDEFLVLASDGAYILNPSIHSIFTEKIN